MARAAYNPTLPQHFKIYFWIGRYTNFFWNQSQFFLKVSKTKEVRYIDRLTSPKFSRGPCFVYTDIRMLIYLHLLEETRNLSSFHCEEILFNFRVFDKDKVIIFCELAPTWIYNHNLVLQPTFKLSNFFLMISPLQNELRFQLLAPLIWEGGTNWKSMSVPALK